MSYDYKNGKQRIINILTTKIDIEEVKTIPKTLSEFTYDNAKVTWISAIFIDLRNSTKFLEEGEKEKVTKVLRAYASEIIQILNELDNIRETGVRGDGVFGIFTTNSKDKVKEVLDLTYWINTHMKMLNKLLIENGFDEIKAGIGMSTSKDLIAKVGRKGTGVNDRVWIGKCVAKADHLSKITNKSTSPIAINVTAYSNSKDVDEKVSNYFKYDSKEDCYFGSAFKKDFNRWIDSGMKI